MNFLGLEIRRSRTAPPVQVWGDGSSYGFQFSPYMGVKELLSNSTVAACVHIISDAISTLPLNVYRETADGREKFTKSAIWNIIHTKPNDDDFHTAFMGQMVSHLLLRGNAFIFIDRASGMNPKINGLYCLDPDRTEIKRDEAGDIYYIYTVDGRSYRYSTLQVLHIVAYKWDGARGLSPLEYATHAAKTGLQIEQYTSDYFDNGVHSKFMVTVPQELKNWDENNTKQLQNRFTDLYAGRENAQKPLIMNKGMTVQPINTSGNVESQLVENRNFSEREIAKIFRVPLFMLGNADAKFSNMELLNSSFIQHTLTPWLVRIQEALNTLLPVTEREQGAYIEFDTNAMMRADSNARWDAYAKAFNIGAITIDEIRRKENMTTLPDGVGAVPFVPVNLMQLTKENLDAYMAQQKKTLGENSK